MASAPATTIASLQAGRGLAAIAVVLFHANLYVGQQVGALPPLLSSAMSLGYLGVDFFFVLSGFIIFHTNRDRVGRGGWGAVYAEKRLTRIYLPYLPIGIAVALGYALFPGASRGHHDWGWLATITLLPGARPPALATAWTLQHEILFYAFAFVVMRSGRILPGAALWAALILVLLPFRTAFVPGVSPLDLEFLFGMAACWWLGEMGRRRHLLAFAAGTMLIAGWLVWRERAFSPVFGLGLALLLPALVIWERSGRLRIARWWLLLGDASYAIYLVHLPLMSVAMRACRGMDPLAAAAIALGASLAAGIAWHKGFERPVLRAVRRRLKPAPEPAPQ